MGMDRQHTAPSCQPDLCLASLLMEGPVSDSNAIIELLEALAPEPRLMPEDPFKAAKVRSLLGFHDTRVEAAARTLFPVIKSDWRANSGPIDTGIAGIEAALERLDTMVAPSPFILGKTPCFADLAYPVTLQMAEIMAAEMEREITVPDRIKHMANRNREAGFSRQIFDHRP